MKDLLDYLLSVILVSVITVAAVLSSCENNRPSSGDDYAPDDQLAVFRLAPEWQSQVFVSPVVDSAVVEHNNRIPKLTRLYYADGLVLYSPTMTNELLMDFAQSQFFPSGFTCTLHKPHPASACKPNSSNYKF